MFGNNSILKPINASGDQLEVNEVFATFQGEGPFVGYPAVFLRLSGCNLACAFCDTDFDAIDHMSLVSLIEQIKLLSENGKKNLVVITGGEPFRQPIEKLCDLLIAANFSVQIETNGTLYRRIHPEVSIVCSPKNVGKGYHPIRSDLVSRLNALKFIISNSNDHYNHVPEVGQTDYNIPVYLQPMDEYDERKNNENLELVKVLAAKHGYRISLQTHKIMGIK